jgi:hypothetical protein
MLNASRAADNSDAKLCSRMTHHHIPCSHLQSFCASGEISGLVTLVTLTRALHEPMMYEETRWNDNDREKQNKSEETCPSATLSTTNPTWTDPGVNPGLCSERPATSPTEQWHGLFVP